MDSAMTYEEDDQNLPCEYQFLSAIKKACWGLDLGIVFLLGYNYCRFELSYRRESFVQLAGILQNYLETQKLGENELDRIYRKLYIQDTLGEVLGFECFGNEREAFEEVNEEIQLIIKKCRRKMYQKANPITSQTFEGQIEPSFASVGADQRDDEEDKLDDRLEPLQNYGSRVYSEFDEELEFREPEKALNIKKAHSRKRNASQIDTFAEKTDYSCQNINLQPQYTYQSAPHNSFHPQNHAPTSLSQPNPDYQLAMDSFSKEQEELKEAQHNRHKIEESDHQLAQQTYLKLNNTELTCPICNQPMAESMETLDCQHVVHPHCKYLPCPCYKQESIPA
ncbi:unnamed protein product [Moneuplotes crassus]|uniref:Uncharacterized protein n=1 Tax=Euplotes crassus TaxID=5936 RepID=A0AAD1XLL8_EUPCR|nr:unnamed protein product [Moneuplotes crassus]